MESLRPSTIRLAWLLGVAGFGLMAGVPAASDAAVVAWVTNWVAGGNGNGLVDRRECNDFSIVLSNLSGNVVSGLQGALGSTTPEVEIAEPNATYPDLPPGGTATNLTAFKVSTTVSFVCGTRIDFTLTLTDSNGLVDVIPFTQTTPTDCTDGGGTCPIVLRGGLVQTDPLQDGILVPTLNPSACGTAAACPGVLPYGPRRYKAYLFVNLDRVDKCVTVRLSSNCDNEDENILAAGYLDPFNPADPCENYLGYVGFYPTPGAPAVGQFVVPASPQFLVVVQDASIDGSGGCDDYVLEVSADQGYIRYGPQLRIARQDPSVVVSWPTNAFDYVLESTLNLTPPIFLAETNAPAIVFDNFFLTNRAGEPSRFYRLRQIQ